MPKLNIKKGWAYNELMNGRDFQARAILLTRVA